MRALKHSLACMLLLGTAINSYADQVVLKNGDIITGKLVAKRDNTLVFNTAYSGDINIAWDKVSTLSTDKPVTTLLGDDSYVKTSLLPGPRGNVRLMQPAAAEEKEELAGVDDSAHGLNDILYINPTPEESGRGYKTTGRANLAVSQTKGNSVNQQGHVDGQIQMRARDWRYTLGGEANQASSNEVSSSFNRRAYTSYDSFFSKKNFVYAQGSLEMDKFKDINLRSVVGGGYGYQVYETETTKLSLKTGLDYVTVDHYVAEAERFAALGWHIDFNHKVQRWPIEVFHIQDGYRGLNSEADVLLKTRTGVRIPIKDRLSATAQLNADWESNPAPGRKNTDTTLMFGLGYSYN